MMDSTSSEKGDAKTPFFCLQCESFLFKMSDVKFHVPPVVLQPKSQSDLEQNYSS